MRSRKNARGKCMAGVMANPGFSDLSITSKGHRITIPQALIKRGAIPTDLAAKLNDLSVGNIAHLNQVYGITVERVSDELATNNIQEVM